MVTHANASVSESPAEVSEAQLRQMAESVWTTTLKLDLLPGDRSLDFPLDERDIAACVQITGAWEGAVALHCPVSVARVAAAHMFGIAIGEPTNDDMSDAIGELANMLGGNVKSLLPEPCRLSLPAVVVGADYHARVPGATLITYASFDCGGHPMWVQLLRRDPSIPTRR